MALDLRVPEILGLGFFPGSRSGNNILKGVVLHYVWERCELQSSPKKITRKSRIRNIPIPPPSQTQDLLGLVSPIN